MDRSHEHEHEHAHAHVHAEPPTEMLRLEHKLLAKNDRLAGANRAWFGAREILALNLVSSPGAGKTTLLERTIRDAGLPIHVIEGDQATDRDAARIRAAGSPVIQINTGSGCHLDAHMIAHAAEDLDPPKGAVVMIENVGNLVCPALFDLGERAKVVVMSVTEGDDKPLKYPHMFRASELMVVSKMDLLPHVDFDVDQAIENARRIRPTIQVMMVSAKTGEGLSGWFDWLERRRTTAPGSASE